MAQESSNPPPIAEVKPVKRKRTRSSKKPRKLPPYNVVLLDDDDHTYDYVVEMLGKLFGHGLEKAFQLAKEVDAQGRVIVLTTTKEHAELKRNQIRAYGKDIRLERSSGSMKAVIEPVEG